MRLNISVLRGKREAGRWARAGGKLGRCGGGSGGGGCGGGRRGNRRGRRRVTGSVRAVNAVS